MRLREPEMPLDPEIERELDAIDSALAGDQVDPDLEGLAQLARELRRERPELTAAALVELDELAAAGFPPRASDHLARLHRRTASASRPLREKSAHRLVPALGAVSVFVVAIGVGISQSGVLDSGEDGGQNGGVVRVEGGGAAPYLSGSKTGRDAAPPADPSKDPGFDHAARGVESYTQHLPAGRYAYSGDGSSKRQVAQDVDLGLSTAPEDFRDAADGVLDVVDDHRGFVVRSNVSGGDPGVAGAQRGRASFRLRIPAGELSSALGDLSNLGHVVSRSDGSVDVTDRFVSARDRIDALTPARDRLLQRLEEASTFAEQQSIRAQLRIVQARLADAHQDLDRARQRVHLVPVGVTIAADGEASAGGQWTIGDALDDAGRVLTVSAGVALVAAAALLPLALLVVLVASGRREWVRRQRDRVLDAAPGSNPS
jgi:hypothetical protein